MSQFINHYVAVRLRVKGNGLLKTTLYSSDDIYNQPLTNLLMSSTLATSPSLLANFKQEKVSLEIKTTEISERFEIRRILIYSKPVGTGGVV